MAALHQTAEFDRNRSDHLVQEVAASAAIGPVPTLQDLTGKVRARITHFIISSTLGGGVAPTAVIALYADLDGDEQATRYVDQRFTLKVVPPGWREVEDRVVDLADASRARGQDLATAWQRANAVAIRSEEPLDQLARLAGVSSNLLRPGRSIFDDPEDLDEEELGSEEEGARYPRLDHREPDLEDLEISAQARIRRFAIEERLEHGLPAVELLDLYRGFELSGDDRARQYLDRVYVDESLPLDWQDLQAEARRTMDLADYRGKDAGRLYADVLRGSTGMDPVVALRVVAERLELGIK